MESSDVDQLLKSGMRQKSCCRPRKVRKADGTYSYVRCQSKKASECVACSTLFLTDQKRLIGSGCNASERDGITEEMLSGFRFYFVTLTAPSFGGIHRVPKGKDSASVVCKCGKRHQHGSEFRGTPTSPRWYKYREQARWNQASSQLFKRTIKYTEDLLPAVEWSFAREWQVRGALHFHGIVRVPAEYDEVQTWQALQRMRTYTYGDFEWGKEIDVQVISGDSASGSVRYMAKVVAYTAKQQGEEGPISATRRRHYERLDWHAARLVCGKRGCRGDGTCEGAAHRSFGYAGQMITRSQGWSLAGLTRGTLVLERKKYATENASSQHQMRLETLAKAWDTERRAELNQSLVTTGLNRDLLREVEDAFFGKTAGESSSVSGGVATVN